jgi:hypothetical protein
MRCVDLLALQVLTLCAHMKSMRNFRLVTDTQVVPPWSLPITATGNTFLHTNPEFSPKVGPHGRDHDMGHGSRSL